jgi:hypothetical protein
MVLADLAQLVSLVAKFFVVIVVAMTVPLYVIEIESAIGLH